MMTRHHPSLSAYSCAATLLLAILLLPGCTPDDPKGNAIDRFIEKVEDHTKTTNEIKALEKEMKQVRAQQPGVQLQLDQTQKKIEELKTELKALGSGADQAYIDLKESMANSDDETIIINCQRFIRDYPLSGNLDEVRTTIAEAKARRDAESNRIAREKAEREAKLAAERKARLAKFRAGKMSSSELKDYLAGKSQQEIVQLLGQPRSRANSSVWDYRGNYATDEQGRFRGIRIFFNGGRVNSVGLL